MTRMKTIALTVAACLALGTAGCTKTKEPIKPARAPDVKTEPITEMKTTTHNKLAAARAALPPYSSNIKLDHQLLEAIKKNDVHTVKELLAKGADVNARGFGGDTALMVAAQENHPNMISFLIKMGANKDEVNLLDETALVQAAKYGNIEAMKVLIKHHANLEVKEGDFKETALMRAIYYEETEAAILLINAGADVNTAGENGQTPLMYTAGDQDWIGDLELTKLLIAKKARINEKDSAGYSALMRAALAQDDGMIKLLIDAGADIKGDLEFARKKSSYETAETTLEVLYFGDVVRSLEEHIKSSPVEGKCSDDWNNVGGSHHIREGNSWTVID